MPKTKTKPAVKVQSQDGGKFSVYSYLLKDWRFWLIIGIVLLFFIFAIIGNSNSSPQQSGITIDDSKTTNQQQVSESEDVDADFIGANSSVGDALAVASLAVTQWLGLIVLLAVVGIILGIFVKLAGIFRR